MGIEGTPPQGLNVFSADRGCTAVWLGLLVAQVSLQFDKFGSAQIEFKNPVEVEHLQPSSAVL